MQVVDEDEEEAKVSFMEFQGQDQFQWPLKPDTVWIPFKSILCKIEKPAATGRSMRLFKLDMLTFDLIEDIYLTMTSRK